MEITESEKVNIRATLNNLGIGESYAFLLSVYNLDSVLSCRTRLQKSDGKKFSSATDELNVTITRLV